MSEVTFRRYAITFRILLYHSYIPDRAFVTSFFHIPIMIDTIFIVLFNLPNQVSVVEEPKSCIVQKHNCFAPER